MGRAILGLTGLSALRFPSAVRAKTTALTETKSPAGIIMRTLGKTGIRLPIVNMGVMNTLDPALVKKAYEIGVRHFDTAAYYMRGQNEIMLGQAIKDLKARDQVIIGTKIFVPHQQRNLPADRLKAIYLKTMDESLKRLQTDHVDVLYSHSIDDVKFLNQPGVVEALLQLKAEKKTRFIGFTTHQNMTECIQSAVQTGIYDVICTAFNYALSDDPALIAALKSAAQKGIGLIAMKTQCTQYWYREELPPALQTYYQGDILHTAVLKWALRNAWITTAIPGFTTFEQMEQDFSVASNLEYSAEEQKFLQARGVKFSLNYCRQCATCRPSCPHQVDVPNLMRVHLYATCYANFDHARQTLQEIKPGHGLEQCTQCRACVARCPHQIKIARRIGELRQIFA